MNFTAKQEKHVDKVLRRLFETNSMTEENRKL